MLTDDHILLWLRDTTVQTLTVQPSVQQGRITYEDSPLVRLSLFISSSPFLLLATPGHVFEFS